MRVLLLLFTIAVTFARYRLALLVSFSKIAWPFIGDKIWRTPLHTFMQSLVRHRLFLVTGADRKHPLGVMLV